MSYTRNSFTFRNNSWRGSLLRGNIIGTRMINLKKVASFQRTMCVEKKFISENSSFQRGLSSKLFSFCNPGGGSP